MRTVVDCVSSFIPLLSTEYEIVLGRKNVAIKLIITFDKKDCFHLMGLQYLTDRPELRRDRGKIFDEIQNGIIKRENIESSDFYHKIQDRVHFLPLLEKMLDSNDTVFKYNKKANVYSMIKADYLMKNHICFYLMQEMTVIFVVLFSQRRKWIIQRIKLHGLSYIRKKEILLMGQNIYYTTD
ncbi:Uncharacterised protein [uncultured Eubacterium sp.]|mgnify:CR=1 FL=1|nr:Uncharacterised protein [uncultured Eubacterium sp.]